MISPRTLCLASLVTALPATAAEVQPFEFSSPSAVTRASGLQGRIVETRGGEELGRIHDFALDLQSGRIAYVVVSVGSFLIEDSLISVAPGALRESADADGRLVLEADAEALRNARRFSAGDWPVRAQVLASAAEPREDGSQAGSPQASEDSPGRGTATITSERKTATLSAGERSIRVEEHAPAPVPGAHPPEPSGERPAPDTPFGRLDEDGDGLLNRAEIAHELTRRDSYSDIDLDGDGVIDAGEFDALMERRQTAEAEAPSP